jgi:hypothetical protein
MGSGVKPISARKGGFVNDFVLCLQVLRLGSQGLLMCVRTIQGILTNQCIYNNPPILT